jgi:hypothetical protein
MAKGRFEHGIQAWWVPQKGQQPGWWLPRCQARSKQTKQRCRLIALTGKTVCRVHGGVGGGVFRNSNAMIHGRRSTRAEHEKRERSAAAKLARAAVRKSIHKANRIIRRTK